jgi:hypothetical protein
MSFSDYLENKLLDHVFKVASFSVPSNLYIALSTVDPGETGGSLAEPSGNNYSRVNHNTWATSSGGATSNTGSVTFPTASGSWGTIAYVCIFDASSGGNLIASGALSVSKSVTSGDTLQFASGDIDVTLN